ncbi:MAG: THUMP domain-containing class I SAM-dependent RNA methyltransferase [Gemmatimonadales bacterium]
MRAEYDCYAITAPRIEPATARELAALGLEAAAVEPGGVAFSAGAAGLYAANLELRTASRVLVRVGSFHASAFHELERRARRLPWDRFLAPGATPDFRVTARKSKLYHQDAIAERLGEAAGRGRERAGEGPGQLFVVRFFRDECTVSADSSGELLHRRGYRLDMGTAPLRETLAAAMLLESGWDGQSPLADPFCGSGTIPIEAALIARRIAPGLARGFAFEHWPELDMRAWDRLRAAARARVLDRARASILGADRDGNALAAAGGNAERAGVAKDLELRRATMSAFEPPGPSGHIVTNPPYGVRLGERAKLRGLYARFGQIVRTRCPGWQVTMLSPQRQLEHATGLPFESRLLTTNGGLRVRLVSTAGT